MSRLFAALPLRLVFASLLALAAATGCNPVDGSDTDPDLDDETEEALADSQDAFHGDDVDAEDTSPARDSSSPVTCAGCDRRMGVPSKAHLPGKGPVVRTGNQRAPLPLDKKGSFD